MEEDNIIEDNENTITNNIKDNTVNKYEVNDKKVDLENLSTFDKLKELQILIRKESSLRELCK